MIASAPRPARRRVGCAALAVVAALGALLGGCGGSDDGATTGGQPRPEARQAPPRIVVAAAENGFDAARVYREAAPGVVTIRAIFGGGGLLGSGAAAAEGSGVVVSDDGEIITNAHVVTEGAGSGREQADDVFVEFSDRNVARAEVVGFDPFYDVALLKVESEGLDLHPLELGSDRDLVVGQPVAAIGSPFGEQQSLSIGVVSATDRSVRSLTQFQIEGAIQTDASINPGNSGGPLLDAGARVIGINQQIETQSGANNGVGFAVPISAVVRSLEQLRRNGEVAYAYIGVSSQALYPQLAERLGFDVDFGALVAEVVSGGPADEAGLRGGDEPLRFQAGSYRSGGDVILSVEGRRVIEPDDLARHIASFSPGEEVTLEILRDGKRRELTVTLGERPTTLNSG
ncbi:MAG TPA: trypsin-like peptidase domain-containing protein [Solirubrobacterales bacterium]|nr:trypsin-like peptidase domain-containing protein [Solirubrobacterales bacterium]